MDKFSYSLKEIASWAAEDSEVTIPALQRGLVWKPNQVELLWDSILRGFPIGSFLLSDIVEKRSQKHIGHYYLMDGQQRFNSISIGFNNEPNARAVLWIDVEPPIVKNSTRRFWIKATTIPHPWGYKNDDDCSRLNTAEIRNALNTFDLKGTIYNSVFSLFSTWPVEANCPIPLYCLLNASYDSVNADMFYKKVISSFQSTDFSFRKNEKIMSLSVKAVAYIKEVLYPVFSSLKEYRINCNHLSKNVIESETLTEEGEQTTLEVLFTRLNTGGTEISRDDLNYSAIKAYWPDIKDINDKLSEKYMNPSKLAMLAFRLALTKQDDDSFKNELSIRQIRGLAKKRSERNKIESIYQNNQLEYILKRIDDWLGVSKDGIQSTPSILRTIISTNSPDVYLLLMYFAYIDINSHIDLTSDQIMALAFTLHWFAAYNNQKGCVQEIFRQCKTGITIANVQKGLSQLMHDCKLLHIYNPTEVKGFLLVTDKPFDLDSVPAPAREFFDRIFWNGNAESKEMLLYAEREYINSHFSNYDPARQDLWAEYNRPWDFDHIVARNRIERMRGPYRDFDKIWLDSIGNFAAISYEANRSKSDGSNYNEYHENVESLDFDSDIEKLCCFNITYSIEASMLFASITYNRFCRIYSKVYKSISVILEPTILSETLQERKKLMIQIASNYSDAIIHFAASDGNDYLLIRDQDWAREWIGVGVKRGDYMICFEWPISNDSPRYMEIGIRKAIGTVVTKDKMEKLKGVNYENEALNPWWYECKDNLNTIDINTIRKEFERYIQICQKAIEKC